MNIEIARAWEKRSKIFGANRKSVMEQSFPTVFNDFIEKIHLYEIKKIINPKMKYCLDIGCGYGRLAQEISRTHPNIFINGIDISPTFVKFFNKKLRKKGKAVVGDICKLPFKNNSFDYVWIVVSFMYLELEKDQKIGMKEIFRVLKPGGTVVLIEPNSLGVQTAKLGGLIPYLYRIILRKKKVETFGISFRWRRIDNLIKNSGGKLSKKKGYPFFTIFFLPILAISKISQTLAGVVLAIVYKIDNFFPIARFSYFITYVAIKNKLN